MQPPGLEAKPRRAVAQRWRRYTEGRGGGYFRFGAAALAAGAFWAFFCEVALAFALPCAFCFWFAFGDLSPMMGTGSPGHR